MHAHLSRSGTRRSSSHPALLWFLFALATLALSSCQVRQVSPVVEADYGASGHSSKSVHTSYEK